MIANWDNIQEILELWKTSNPTLELKAWEVSQGLAEQFFQTFEQVPVTDPETFALAAAVAILSDNSDFADEVLVSGSSHGLKEWLKKKSGIEMCEVLSYRLGILLETTKYHPLEGHQMLQSAWLGQTELLPAGALALKHTAPGAWWDADNGLNVEYLASLFVSTVHLAKISDEEKIDALNRADWLIQTFESYGDSYRFLEEVKNLTA